MTVLTQGRRRLRSLLAKPPRETDELSVAFVASGPGWLRSHLPQGWFLPPRPPDFDAIEGRAAATQQAGPKPLWEGYRTVAGYARSVIEARTSEEVRSDATTGCFFAWLARERVPAVIAEIGTAFGVSGMYWLSGLKANGVGRLVTFEPNVAWAELADENLRSIDDRYALIRGPFEDHAAAALAGEPVDMAFVDGIHTGEFVRRELAILRNHARSGALLLFDDINFSDDMRASWAAMARGPGVVASALIGGRVGILELA
jgi:predicted O-methyltransferase YrrM